MQTLGSRSLVNAGFIFFAFTILATLVFGRFFCGWGCHIVALQDMCTWFLKRIGIQPKPFRSRLLVFVPLLAAIHMFVMPTIVRAWIGGEKADYEMHLATEDFWERFPEWPIATLTFVVCGFLIVYVLGNKGFCTYGCPYGGIFGLVDAAAPGKIRVTDACEGCAHCTARCTSNVLVHDEVRRFGMVVDPGCMKCLDCVSVCPKDALYFGFGKPSILNKSNPETKPKTRFDYTWKEEGIMATIFIVAIVILYGLYDRVPFLLALGVAAISTYLLFTAMRMGRQTSLRFGQHHVRRGGRTTRFGIVVIILAFACAAFLVQSATAKTLAFVGGRRLNQAQAAINDGGGIGKDERGLFESGIRLINLSNSIGLVPMARHEWSMARAHQTLGRFEEADACYRRAVAISSRQLAARFEVARYAIENGNLADGEAQLREILERDPGYPSAAKMLGAVLFRQNRGSEAVSTMQRLYDDRPDNCDIGIALATAHHLNGDAKRCLQLARSLVDRHPTNAEAHVFLATALVRSDAPEDGQQLLRRAIELDSSLARPHFMLATLILRSGITREGIDHLESALNLEPYNVEFTRFWAQLVQQTEDVNAAIIKWENKPPKDRVARFRLMHLYEVAGRRDEYRAIANELNRAGFTTSSNSP
ncbi:MAG: hypothetical protein DHS20C16_28300 [Phycisphaerae bacterium]|nr:MAG: hypothetical protein DHS20C16_28300 [Phycisphaerae bacterium]